jgi:hypothetical protein
MREFPQGESGMLRGKRGNSYVRPFGVQTRFRKNSASRRNNSWISGQMREALPIIIDTLSGPMNCRLEI